jgi:HSP20 family protein
MAEVATKLPVKTNGKGREEAAALQPWRPFASLRHEVDRLFEEFDGGFGRWRLPRSFFGGDIVRAPAPAVDIAESDKAYEVTAELPGMAEADVQVEVINGDLRIKGEKKEEKEEKGKEYYLSERRYGSFERRFTIPEGVDVDKIDATFKGGVLTVTLPKTAAAQKAAKKITVKAS